MFHSNTALIDTHAHFVTSDYVESATHAGHVTPDGMPWWPSWSADEHLALMDEVGIARAVLSISSPGVHFGDDSRAAELATLVNDQAVETVRRHPNRFAFFASLPLPDIDSALREVERVRRLPGHAGFCLMSNAAGVYLGDERYEPLWRRLDEIAAVVFVHPTAPPNARLVSPNRPFPMIEFIFDEARTFVDLIFASVPERFPRIRFIVSHSGGALPLLLERVDLFYSGSGLGGDPGRLGQLHETFRNWWFDCAGTPTPHALSALRRVADDNRLLYGSDYCFAQVDAVREHRAKLDELGADLVTRLAANGARLLEVPDDLATPGPEERSAIKTTT